MREYRFYTALENIHNDIVVLDGDEHNHLSKVLRLTEGTNVTILSSDNLVRDCVITSITKRDTTLQVLDTAECVEHLPDVTLFQALVRADKMDLIVQKCTELGLKRFVPFQSEYCTVQDKGNKIDRLNRIVLASCKQSGRLSAMTIEPTIQFADLLGRLSEFDYVIFANEKECKSASSILGKLTKKDKIAIVIGCEGGFSPSEASALIDAGAQSLSLGKLILRAETASIALTSVIMYTIGEWER
ncbi:MAG: 16S rRNA (uracil(1498)-N(3))-methyltransferase [Clostridia bacterium]|nr:16S rRNA (uracil(1498)-N(3))-methyltransferase [Clostridia bacterium]